MLVTNSKVRTRHLFLHVSDKCSHSSAAICGSLLTAWGHNTPDSGSTPLHEPPQWREMIASSGAILHAGLEDSIVGLVGLPRTGGGARGGTLRALPFIVISLGPNNRSRTQCCYQSQATMCIPPGLIWGGFPLLQQLLRKGMNQTLITFPLHIILYCVT